MDGLPLRCLWHFSPQEDHIYAKKTFFGVFTALTIALLASSVALDTYAPDRVSSSIDLQLASKVIQQGTHYICYSTCASSKNRPTDLCVKQELRAAILKKRLTSDGLCTIKVFLMATPGCELSLKNLQSLSATARLKTVEEFTSAFLF
jgi:hypothetical protein